MILFAESSADTKEFAKGEGGRCSESRILKEKKLSTE